MKPNVTGYVTTTIDTLINSVNTSQEVMKITGEALGATVESVDALSSMLATTATSMDDSKPALDQINTFMSDTLPSTLESATESLKTAQQAAVELDSTIVSLDSFRSVISATPFLGAFVVPAEPYDPEVPLAESLGEVASNLEDLPKMFTEMAASLDNADDNLVSIRTNLTTMSTSVKSISKSLSEY